MVVVVVLIVEVVVVVLVVVVIVVVLESVVVVYVVVPPPPLSSPAQMSVVDITTANPYLPHTDKRYPEAKQILGPVSPSFWYTQFVRQS